MRRLLAQTAAILVPGAGVLPRIFAMCGLLLVPWIGVLSQYGAVGKRGLDSAWVGLDVLEAICLLTTAGLASRRQPATSPVAAATAAIFCMDAWFDTMSAAPQLPYAESLAMACLAELPLAALLAWTAWRALGWAARPPQCQERKAVAAAADLFDGTDSVAALGAVGLRDGLRGSACALSPPGENRPNPSAPGAVSCPVAGKVSCPVAGKSALSH